jgi:hypothetical protein
LDIQTFDVDLALLPGVEPGSSGRKPGVLAITPQEH